MQNTPQGTILSIIQIWDLGQMRRFLEVCTCCAVFDMPCFCFANSNSFKKTLPPLLLAKIDDKLEQYTNAVEVSSD